MLQVFRTLHRALEELPGLRTTDGTVGDLPAVYIFMPGGTGTWVLWEYDPESHTAYGLCDLGFPEIGYVDIEDLAKARTEFGLPPEIDRYTHTRFAGYRLANVEIPWFLEGKAPK